MANKGTKRKYGWQHYHQFGVQCEQCYAAHPQDHLEVRRLTARQRRLAEPKEKGLDRRK